MWQNLNNQEIEYYIKIADECALNKKDDEAKKWYRQAADLGSQKAKCRLGDYEKLNLFGQLCANIEEKWNRLGYWNFTKYCCALRDNYSGELWYLRASEYGNAKASYDLGEVYYKIGSRFGKTPRLILWEIAAEFYQKAFLQAFEDDDKEASKAGRCAYRCLENLYIGKWDDIDPDYDKLIRLCYEVIKQDKNFAKRFAYACLGVCYYHGHGVQKNNLEASKNFAKAFADGYQVIFLEGELKEALDGLGIC